MNHHVSRALRPVLAALALAACSIAAAADPAVPQTAVQWRQAAIDDIEESVRLTRDNHPGTYDRANPAFPARLAAARSAALALASRVDGPAAYMAAMMRFDATLGDGHAGIYPQLGPAVQAPVRWPGFVTAWRQGGLFVQASDSAVPAVGARVLDCDGKPFIALPGRCRFSADGRIAGRDLAWKVVDEQATGWLKDGYNGPVLDVGITEPRKGLFWVAMPTFEPDEAQRAAYRAMTAQVAGQRQRFMDADAVVIDLRRNQGGSSA